MPNMPRRVCNPEAARARYGDRVDRLIPYFWQTDPLADVAVEALSVHSYGRASALINEMLACGATDEAPEPLRLLIEEAERVPMWVNWEAVERGGALLMRAGVLGGIVLAVKALVYGYASPAGNKPLILSGRLREQAIRRLDETSRFVQAVARPRGMRPGGDGLHITLKVRLMHAQVRRMIMRSGRWRSDEWGAPINQHDMVATILLFSFVTLEGLRQFGLHITPAESDDYMHLWRYVGHVIGVDDELLPTTEREARVLCDLIAITQGPPDEDSRALVRALLEAGERSPSPARRARTKRIRPLADGLCRSLIGDALADELAVPRTPWRHALRAVRSLVMALEEVRRRSHVANVGMVWLGESYWDMIIREGLAGAGAEFGLPERLAVKLSA